MSRIVVIGYGPLPQPGLNIFSAASLRTRQILRGVVEAGHEISLFVLPQQGTPGADSSEHTLVEDQYEGLAYRRFSAHNGEFAVQVLNKHIQAIAPDAMVGVGTYPSYLASMLSTTVPLWCDLNGCWMAEIQAKCVAVDDDVHLASAWNIERAILRRLDKFSAVSRPHLHSVIGELATVGRLNKYTFEYPFGSRIPNAVHHWKTDGESPDLDERVLRGPVVPEDAFVLLWSGGFKIWSDTDMLLQSIHELMGRHQEVHFVSTGGSLTGADQQVYRQVEEAVAASPYRDRFHLLGWVDSEKLQRIYREADLGLNLDAPNYETMFGARNRILAMAEAGLPVLTTLGTEISEWMDDARAALTIPMRDPQAFVETVAPFIADKSDLKDFSRRSLKFIKDDFSIATTTRPLCNWLASPNSAPDNQVKIKNGASDILHLGSMALNSMEEQFLPSRAEPKPPQKEAPPPPSEVEVGFSPSPRGLGRISKFLGFKR